MGYDYNKWLECMDFLVNQHMMEYEKFELIFPLGIYRKTRKVVEVGLAEGLTKEEMSATVSCNSEPPCASCPKCKERMELGLKIN